MDESSKVFKIVIQLGAILAVCWDYRQRLRKMLQDPADPHWDMSRFVA